MQVVSPLGRRLAPLLALSGLSVVAAFVLAPFLTPLAWAGILAYTSWPVAQWIRLRCGARETLAASLSTLLAALMLFAPLLWLAWLAQQEMGAFYRGLQALLLAPPALPDSLANLPWLGDWLVEQRALLISDPQGVMDAVKAWIVAHAGDAAAIVGGAGRNLAKLVLVLIILFFFYRDGVRILAELRHVLARFIGESAHDYLAAAGATTRAVVYGVLLTALVQGAFAGVGYWVAGLGSPVTLGVMTALFALIPFGTPLAWGGAGAWLLFQGETSAAVGIWIWGGAVVSQIDNVLRPIFISSVSAIPFLLVLFGVLGGILAFGLVGLFTGPIVLAVAWAIWREWTAHLDEAEPEK
ncbi:MAG: AI-2E family transporter [Hydrogenophilales bacterium 28-61-23]|nr:MAG: AI-2E family transporter [Hydrogenophilales bacterium 28-61-23]